MSRRRVIWIVVLLLVLLDVGRSINVRRQYAAPAETWQPNPATYADLAWPPGRDPRLSASVGARVYARWCAVCHGPDGRGNGPAAPSLIPRPRDFTLGLFKYKSTPSGLPPTDEDLIQTIQNGLPGSAMPYFRDLLNDTEIRAVVSQIKQFSKAFARSAHPSISIQAPAADAGSVSRGRAIYQTQGCAGCHGLDPRNGGFLQDAKNYPVHVRDLTAPWTFGGGSSPNQIWLRLTTGLAGSSMPSYENTLTADQRWDLVRFLESQKRVAPWERGGKLGGRGQHPDLLQRGEYIVHAEMCGLCHTQINRTGIYRGDDYYLAGGMRVIAYPHGVFITRNLTSDKQTGIGRWSESQIVNAIRNGRAPDRLLNLWGMPWFFLHYFTDSDATAIARYLKSLPPVRNRIPPPVHYGVIETIASKLTRRLPAAPVTVLSYADGNFGRKDSASFGESLQKILINLQWLILILGAIVFFFAAKQGKRLPNTWRSWLMIAVLILIGAVVWVFYSLPMLKFIPPEQIVSGATAGIPVPDPALFKSPEHKQMVERGRYLYTVASCAFCHLPNGEGGRKISWRPFGTLWVRNITSDQKTGIGAWKDEEIIRAIRSGITPDGRVLHWQGMIWDHASNWDEEDLRSIVAYLRTLPPVSHAIPPARPPAPDDCDVYTFWIAESSIPGCR
jgi:mono/diheme cytochrome c family protein